MSITQIASVKMTEENAFRHLPREIIANILIMASDEIRLNRGSDKAIKFILKFTKNKSLFYYICKFYSDPRLLLIWANYYNYPPSYKHMRVCQRVLKVHPLEMETDFKYIAENMLGNAICAKNTSIINTIFKRVPDISYERALRKICRNGDEEALELLLKNIKMNLDDINKFLRMECINIASESGNSQIFSILLSREMVNQIDLHLTLSKACVNGHTEIVRILLDRADLDRLNRYTNISYFDIAVHRGYDSIVQMLEKTGMFART